MKTNRKNKRWFRNPDQLKTRKVFSILVERNPDSSFRLIGGHNRVLMNKNQHRSDWVNVDTRDLCKELNDSKFHSY
jgi:hypothetical protein